MGHTITPGPLANTVIVTIKDFLTHDDMSCSEEIGLNERPYYILLDAGRMQVALPERFIDGANKSFFTHPNCLHMAVYLRSDLLKNVALMVAKLTRLKHKLTVHDSYDEAIAYLTNIAQENTA